MQRGRMLVVDDEDAVRVTLGAILSDLGHQVTLAASVAEALAALRRTEFDLVLTDLRLAGRDGLRIVRAARRRWPDTETLILTGYASMDSAIGALRFGAYDYLCKPCPADELIATVTRALERRQLRRQVRHQIRDLETAIDTARELHAAQSARLEGTTLLLREREHVLHAICTELNTSLSAIVGVVQLVLAHVQDPARPTQDAHELSGSLQQIQLEIELLVQRVNAALQLMRSESVQVASDAQPAEILEISLAGPRPGAARCDRRRLRLPEPP